MTIWIGGNHFLIRRFPFIKAAPSGKDLIAAWVAAEMEWCAVPDCGREANVLLTTLEGMDEWMCYGHANGELDR